MLDDAKDETCDGKDGEDDVEDDGKEEDETTSQSDEDSQDDEDTRTTCAPEIVKYVSTFRDVEDSVEPFSGDNEKSVLRWLKEFEQMAKLCEWSSVQKTIYARRLLRGSAKSFVNFEQCGKTWKELKKALKIEFAKNVNSHTIHKELAGRQKRGDETYHQYMYKMLDIASQVDMEKEAIIQYIIDGIPDDEANKVILYDARNLRELKMKLTHYEAMKNNAKAKQQNR